MGIYDVYHYCTISFVNVTVVFIWSSIVTETWIVHTYIYNLWPETIVDSAQRMWCPLPSADAELFDE